MDETDYLTSNPANRRRLDEAIAELNIRVRTDLVQVGPGKWIRRADEKPERAPPF